MMEFLGCATEYELMKRVKSSWNMAGWLTYLQLRDEREQERMEKMFATDG
jgi:hypothetical protein